MNEVREVWFGLEEVAEVEYVNTPRALGMDIGHEKTESARTEAATCEGEAEERLGMVTRMADDPLEDFPSQGRRSYSEFTEAREGRRGIESVPR